MNSGKAEKLLADLAVEYSPELKLENAKEPPHDFWAILRSMGPTFVLAGAIVGSGELIATTLLGARIGYVMLWMIILSCLAKVMIQEAIGRYIITTGKGLEEILDEIPGPRLGASWAVWWSILLMLSLLVVMAGIFGSQGLAMKGLVGAGNPNVWGVVVGIIGIALLYRGIYADLERIMVTLVVAFSLITMFLAFVGLQFTPYAYSISDIASGLQFKLPAAGIAVAISVFGMTGLSANELVQYTYWAKGKGYAAWTGPKGVSGWEERARGWIRVMRLDLIIGCVVYTLVTIAFYILGAAVLNKMGITPSGMQLVDDLANMYTQTLGEWAKILFMFAAFVVLWSTYLVNSAGISRVIGDGLIRAKVCKASDLRQVLSWRRFFLIIGPLLMFLLYFVFPNPAGLVVLGGMLLSISLPIIAIISLLLHYKVKRQTPEFSVGSGGEALLWLSVAVNIGFVLGGYLLL